MLRVAGLVGVAALAAGAQLAPVVSLPYAAHGHEVIDQTKRVFAEALHLPPEVLGIEDQPEGETSNPAPAVLAERPEPPEPAAWVGPSRFAGEPTELPAPLSSEAFKLFIQGSQVRTILLCPVDRGLVEPAGDLVGAPGACDGGGGVEAQAGVVVGQAEELEQLPDRWFRLGDQGLVVQLENR